MNSYIRRSPLAFLTAVSFAVFIIFALIDRVAIVCADPQSVLYQGARNRYRTGFARGAGASIRPAVTAQSVPCVFDNFVWFKDQEIIDEIRKDLPSFDGAAPET